MKTLGKREIKFLWGRFVVVVPTKRYNQPQFSFLSYSYILVLLLCRILFCFVIPIKTLGKHIFLLSL